jgi:nucleotide-binding universal stress UspA family protein
VLVVLWVLPGTGRLAAAQALDAALSAFGEVNAVYVLVTVDRGAGSDVQESWEYWTVRDVGSRFELTDQYIEIYDASDRRRSTLDRTTGTVEVMTVEDRMLQREIPEARELIDEPLAPARSTPSPGR